MDLPIPRDLPTDWGHVPARKSRKLRVKPGQHGVRGGVGWRLSAGGGLGWD